MPRSLLRILQLDFYGNADFGGLLAEERGLSAAAGRYILARGPLNPFAPGLASQVEQRDGWIWKTDDHSPGHPSPLTAAGEPGRVSARSTLVAPIACDPGQSYLIEGVLPFQQASGARQRPGPVTCRVVRTRRNAADTLGEMTMTDSDYQSDGLHFACTFESGAISGAYWITLVSSPLPPEERGHGEGVNSFPLSPGGRRQGEGVSLDGQPIPTPRVTLWHLTRGFAEA